MFRRSRFSVRPNVSTAGRSASAPPEATPANQEASEALREVGDSNNASALTEKSDITLSEKAAASGDGSEQNVDGTSSSAAVQRRKRFSVKPKVAPGRPSALSRTPKSPIKAVSQTSVDCSGAGIDKAKASSQTGTTATPKGLQSPRRRRPSEDSKLPKIQPKPTSISLDASEPSAVSSAVQSVEQTHLPADSSKQSENISDRQVKEAHPRPPDRPSIPDKESTELSEKAKTLASSKTVPSLTPSALSLSRLLNDPSDVQRLVKAQKLRDLLREERRKEKKLKKAKAVSKVFNLDPAKMTMRDLIHYLPTSNPMTSGVEELTQENETVLPPSPEREASPEQAQEPEIPPNTMGNTEEEAEEAEEEQEEALMVPQVKVAEDGSLIIDEESLTVEVQRAKGPNPAENRDPIFERGSTTTYSSFRKLNHAKRWTSEETDMFFLAVSMVGTDFSMICQLFPHRARSEIKNKFKKEERENVWRIDKAIRERRKLDIEYFSKLLEKILEYQRSKKKLRSVAEKKPSQKGKRKTKAKKSGRKLSDVEEEDEEDEDGKEVLGLEEEEEEGEKENEDLCNDGEIPVSDAKTKRGKRKNRQIALDEEPNDKRTKRVSTEQGTGTVSGFVVTKHVDEDGVCEEPEAELPDNHKDSDTSEKTRNANTAKDTAIKPAKLSRGRASKPLLPLGRKWSKKPSPCTTTKSTSLNEEDESVNKDPSSLSQASREPVGDDISSEGEEEDAIVKPPRPTRCGRVPKPIKPLTYPAKDEVHSSASETTPASAAGSTASAAKPKSKQAAKKRILPQHDLAPKSKKCKLVTLTASQTEFSDEDSHQWQDEEVEEVELAGSPSKDSSAPVFVPAGLHTPRPEIKEVDETIAELDILATMPDVLGISQDALCPDSACEQAQHETGSAEPCEHQLDLLIDVIEFISSEHAEVSEDQSYNEAAQTLLTIGNLSHVSQSEQNQVDIRDHVTGTASADVNETTHLETELVSDVAVQEESATPSVSTFDHDVTQTSETVATVEQQISKTVSDEMAVKTSDEPHPESSNKNTLQTKRGHFSKIKPKPNLSRVSRTVQSKSQPDISAARTAEESHTESANIKDCSPALLKADISSTEVKLTAKPSESQPDIVGVESAAEIQFQSHSFSESTFEPHRDQATRETKSLSEPTDEKLTSHVEPFETGFKDPPNSDSLITEVEEKLCSIVSPAKESSDKPTGETHAGELSVTEKGESEVSNTCQSRRSRLQKVKPKPNLSQTSRTVRSKPQITIQVEESGSISDPSCTTSEEQVQSPDLDSVKPLLNLGSAPTPPDELSTNKEKKPDAESQQSTQENQNSESQFEHGKQPSSDTGSTSEFTLEKMTSHVEATKSSCDKVVTTHSAVTVSQVGQGANVDSAPVQEGSDQPPVLPVIQKEGEVQGEASTFQLRKARLPKFKPKPNLLQTSRTARSKPQTTKQPEERDPIPTQDPKSRKQSRCLTTEDEQPRSSCSASPEKHVESVDVLLPTTKDGRPDLGAVITGCGPSQCQNLESEFDLKGNQVTNDTKSSSEPTEEKVQSCVETAKSVFNNSATSDLAISKVEQEPCTESEPGQESAEKPPSCVSHPEDLPVRQKEVNKDTTPSPSRRSRMQKVKPKPNLAQSSRISRCKPQTVKPALEKDLSPTSNMRSPEKTTAKVEPQPVCTLSSEKLSENTDPASVLKPSINIVSTSTLSEELLTNEESSLTNVRLDLGAATSDQSASENVNLSASQFEPSRDQVSSETKSASDPEKNMPCITTSVSSCKNVVAPDSAVTVSQAGEAGDAESASLQKSSVHQAVLVAPVQESPLNQEKSEAESASQLRSRRLQKIKPKPNLQQTPRTMQSNSQSTKDPVIHTQVVEKSCSQTCVSESSDYRMKDAEAQPSCSPTSPEKSNEFKSPDAYSVSEPSLESGSSNKCREEISSSEREKTDAVCGPMSRSVSLEQNIPQRLRRFPKVKPKPNLGSSSRITQTKLQPADISKSAEHVDTISNIAPAQDPGDNNDAQKSVKLPEKNLTSGHCSINVEVCSVTSQPVDSEKALGTLDSKDPHPNDPSSPLGCLAQVNEQQSEHDHHSSNSEVPLVPVNQVSSTQNTSTLSTNDIQSFPIFQEMLPEKVPSDPDEPFFILSLTEIPLSSSGEVVNSATENPSCLSVTESSIPQPSGVSGESVAAAGEGSLSNVPMPMFKEIKSVTGLISVEETVLDPSTLIDHNIQKTVDPQEHTTDNPPKFPDAVDNNEPEAALNKHRQTSIGRRAKLQVKPNAARRKQTSKTKSVKAAESAPTQTNTTQEPKASDAVTEAQRGSCSRDEEIEMEAQTSQRCVRKPKGSLSSLSVTKKTSPAQNLPPSKPVSKRSKLKTPLTEGQQSLPEPVASTSHDVPSTQSLTQPLKETRPASITLLTQTAVIIRETCDQSPRSPDPSTSQCTEDDCVDSCALEEEPTSVSQYFLTNIFTEVDEG
ncbi:transcription factor TFIIIB component B'' homolog isoform X2 [Neolamprologus brichardi]|uniref:transcription factor TFIIIB component B'' homolog isoform X2 n=1 Tax=Neolamprologus brichardi TaxID=32507 RepID=UPI001643F015|nr:transcription factor TFIIIB component B'' homolog isoform X2 [Neolamprologus brichardi]